MSRRFAALAAAAALALGAAHAAPPVVAVEAVQYPAWLERGGESRPLEPGTPLAAGDRIRTGADARARLRMSDGAGVKLGEAARFEIVAAADDGVLRARLRVLTGAFRYATEGPRAKGRREIEIQVKNVTAGIRGTDLWGKSDAARDLVCLIEGRITVSSPGAAPVVLDTPRAYYQRPRDGEPGVASVDPQQLGRWARETEMGAAGDQGVAAGAWRVVAARTGDAQAAEGLVARLREAGYPARREGAAAPFAVVVPSLAGEPAARALARRLRGNGLAADAAAARG